MSIYGTLDATTVETTLIVPLGLTGDATGTISNADGGPSANKIAAANGVFDIAGHYSGNPKYQGAFTTVATRWAQIIVGDIVDYTSPSHGLIDDLLIDARILFIDGPGGIRGRAGPDPDELCPGSRSGALVIWTIGQSR